MKVACKPKTLRDQFYDDELMLSEKWMQNHAMVVIQYIVTFKPTHWWIYDTLNSAQSFFMKTHAMIQ